MRIGIGSFAYRYAVGNQGFVPREKMDLYMFAEKAKILGYSCIQICENMRYAEKKLEDLRDVANKMQQLRLDVELGMNGVSEDSLNQHLDLCAEFQSPLLRTVIGYGNLPQEKIYEKAVQAISAIIPRLEQEQIVLGIENHFDLTTDNIVKVIEKFDSPWVRAIYDTTNSIGFMEKPEETLEKLLPYCISAHIKDYEIQKIEAGYKMSGKILGDGMLDLQGQLSRLMSTGNLQSMILEMTIPRMCEDEELVLQIEEEQIYQSTKTLFRHLK